MATEADCARWDAYLLETVAAQRPVMDGPADAPAAERAGEWSVRCAIGAMLERLRLPVRLDASMRFDVEAGAAAFDLKVPGASLMPSWAWREESGWVQASERDRDAQAASLRAASGAGAGCCCIRRFVWNPTRRHRGAAVRERGAELERRK